MKKLRIGVLMGGLSIEKEVSFNSGRTVCDHLNNQDYEIIPLFHTEKNKLYILPIRFLYRGKISDFEHRLVTEAQEVMWGNLKNILDFLYIAEHGRFAEDGTLQGFLEVLGIPYLGTKILGSALGMDKLFQKKLLAAAKILTPRGFGITIQDQEKYTGNDKALADLLQEHELALPVVVKPAAEGSSLGISVVNTLDELSCAIQRASIVTPGVQQAVIVEEYITGMEFTCIVLIDLVTQKALLLPPTEILKEPGHAIHGYEQKYMPGRSQKFTPARCSQEVTKKIQETCVAVVDVLKFSTIARIDGFVTADGSIVIIDPNTIVGMSPSSFFFNQAAEIGMNHTDIITRLLEIELRYYGLKNIDVAELSCDESMGEMSSVKETQKKIRIGVLLGGSSNEKETSLESGRNICYKLSSYKKYEVTSLFVDGKNEIYPLTQRLLVHNATVEIECELDRSTKIAWDKLPELFDFIFIGLHGGIGENGAVQGTLELLKLPYNGSSVVASALAMDKYATNKYLAGQDFSVPKHLLVSQVEWKKESGLVLEKIYKTIVFPAVIKPHDDGCSVLVQKVLTEQELISAIELLFAQGKNCAFIEEFIVGTELTVGVLGNNTIQVLPPSQVVSAHAILTMEEKFLPGAGENQTPALLPEVALELIKQEVGRAYSSVGCSGYARIDCFYQTEVQSPTGTPRVVILEINTLPALTPATCLFHQAAEVGISPREFIDRVVQLGLEKHKNTYGAIAQKDLVHKTESM